MISWRIPDLLFSGEHLHLFRLQQHHMTLSAVSSGRMFNPYLHYCSRAGMAADTVLAELQGVRYDGRRSAQGRDPQSWWRKRLPIMLDKGLVGFRLWYMALTT